MEAEKTLSDLERVSFKDRKSLSNVFSRGWKINPAFPVLPEKVQIDELSIKI